jgi:uncharacterized protein involved in exopolysaccharide biosynthesis
MIESEDVVSGERTLLEGLLYYISILLEYKKFILGTTTLAAILIVIFSIISLKLPPDISPLPNQYRAYAVVLFQEGVSNAGMSSILSSFGVESSGSGTSTSQLAVEILQSRSFIDDVIDQFDIINKFEIFDKPRTNSRILLLGNSEYSFQRDSGALTIAFTHIDPAFASELVNYEVNLLEEWFLNQGVSLRSYEIKLMEEKLNDLSNEISRIEGNIKDFQKKYGVLDIMELATAQSTMLIDLRTNLNQTELQISNYSEYSTIEDPALTILKNQRYNIINQIRKIEGGYTSSDGRQMPSIEELPQLSLSFTHMQADLALKNQLYLTLSERFEVTKLAVAETGAFTVYEYAEIPEEKVGPSRGRLCIMVTFGTFAGSILLALIINMIKHISRDPDKRKILKREDLW